MAPNSGLQQRCTCRTTGTIRERTVTKLLETVDEITKTFLHTYVLLTGDFNADPFANNGKNLRQFRRLMT